MNITIGQRVLYRPAGRFGHVVANFPDRHRVRLRLEATPDLPISEVDEVAYHDLESVDVAPAPARPRGPAAQPQVLDETREDTAGDDRPRRGRRLWPEPPERTDG